MLPFLKQIALLFHKEYGTEIARFAFVFPSRRAGLFFKKYLSEAAGKPVFSPTVFTINDLFIQMSGKRKADRIYLLFTLYNMYMEQSGSDETFDNFLYWGEMLLNDFDDVDKYMADARMLFSNVTDLRSIEQDFSFLNEKQVEAIRAFWSAFYPLDNKANKVEFLAVWEVLYHLYDSFKRKLEGEGCGYEGMLFREVVEKLKAGEDLFPAYEKVVFVGLNALSKVEEELLKLFRKKGLADFYWDYGSSKTRDPLNLSSFFAGNNLRQFPPAFELPAEEEREPEIEVISIPSGVGQAKQVYTILDNLVKENKLNDGNSLNTAIVLPDETLLMPLINSIPESVKHINVTMGYPLSAASVAALIDYVATLQKNLRYIDGQASFYFRDVLPVLNHHYLMYDGSGSAQRLARSIIAHNRIYIGVSEFAGNELLEAVFRPVESADAFLVYLIDLLKIFERIVGRQKASGDEGREDEKAVNIHDVEREFIFHYYAVVNRLNDLIAAMQVNMTADTCFRLVKRMIDSTTVPFEGEPLSGLQIMGVLETRALDFERLLILSVNEGVFPSRSVSASFIPYNLRRGFGLPAYEHQDSIWSYYFYRLLYRANHVALLYDSRSGGLLSGEVSRFVHQLRYHYELPLRDKLLIYNVSSSGSNLLSAGKEGDVMNKLAAFYEGGGKSISASAINTYLDCPLKFYFSVIEEVREEEAVSEMVERDMFGNILHKVMEALYNPLCGELVTENHLALIRKDKAKMSDTIRMAFAREFFNKDDVKALTGQYYLIGEMIRKYALKVLEQDSRLAPFHYIKSEQRINDAIHISGGRVISLKGFIDRVDKVNDVIRIIDYKSGSGTTVFPSVESLFGMNSKDRPKAVMQVFMYAWMYSRLPENRDKNLRISPEIYFMRMLFSPDFDSAVYQKEGRGGRNPVSDFMPYKESFENGLRECLDDIFSVNLPFTQTSVGKTCQYCRFRKICGT